MIDIAKVVATQEAVMDFLDSDTVVHTCDVTKVYVAIAFCQVRHALSMYGLLRSERHIAWSARIYGDRLHTAHKTLQYEGLITWDKHDDNSGIIELKL